MKYFYESTLVIGGGSKLAFFDLIQGGADYE